MGIFHSKKLDVVFVDDNIEDIAGTVGFSPNIFKGKEWTVFKSFCNKRRIKQRDLNLLFQRFLSHPEVYLREFRVRTSDLKVEFMNKERLMQEFADVLVPSILFKEYRGLEKVDVKGDQVSFARFVVMTYIFAAQPIPDLLFDFFAMVRQKLTLKLNAVMFLFNFEQIILVSVEHIEPCVTLEVLLAVCNPRFEKKSGIYPCILLSFSGAIAGMIKKSMFRASF
jgi:hypothetical protein